VLSQVFDPQPNRQKPDEADQRPVKKRRGWAGLFTGLIAGIAMLAATRLGWLWPKADVLSNFTLHVVFWIVAFALASLVPRQKVLGAAVILIVLTTLWGSRSYLGAFDEKSVAVAPNSRAIHIAHFNTYARNKTIDAVQQQIEAIDADVVTVLEARADKLPMIANLKQRYPYSYGCIGEGKCTVAILSKFPFVDTSKKSEAPEQSLPYLWVQFGPELGNLTYIAIHAQRFPNTGRQWSQIDDLRKLIEKHPGNIVVTGDFNSTPYSRIMAEIESVTGLTHLTNLPTWPAQFGVPQLAIDHILVSKGITAASPEYTGLAAGSDHLPIHMSLNLSLH
jgi:endonuclease/exonuclease/phosphatase (EEP) superfamily protein YafD